MIDLFSKYKIIFYLINFGLIFFYLYPGSLFGLILYDNIKVQPQLTQDFMKISSNHFYVFIVISVIGFFSYVKSRDINFLILYLIFLSIILELFHLFIPERNFQWEDLFGNLFGVFIVIFINKLISKYELFKK